MTRSVADAPEVTLAFLRATVICHVVTLHVVLLKRVPFLSIPMRIILASDTTFGDDFTAPHSIGQVI